MRLPFAIFGATVIAVAACGARSTLRVDEPEIAEVDAGPDVFDAAPDIVDAPPDVPVTFDAPFDAPDICGDAGTTYIYVMTAEDVLFRFYPPEGTFVEIGPIQCPAPPGYNPFSMAVDRKGIAYVLFYDSQSDGQVFRVSVANPAQCLPTDFVGSVDFTPSFGMGFSANVDDPGETLYVAGASGSELLATIDLETFETTIIGTIGPSTIGDAELTGNAAGELYGFGVDTTDTTSILHLAQIDKKTAEVLGDQFIDLNTGGAIVRAFAVANWGGDFYFFTSLGGGVSKVTRYHPGDPGGTDLATLNATIVGAGVSTCAPGE